MDYALFTARRTACDECVSVNACCRASGQFTDWRLWRATTRQTCRTTPT